MPQHTKDFTMQVTKKNKMRYGNMHATATTCTKLHAATTTTATTTFKSLWLNGRQQPATSKFNSKSVLLW